MVDAVMLLRMRVVDYKRGVTRGHDDMLQLLPIRHDTLPHYMFTLHGVYARARWRAILLR